jgi:hypothetical protein
MRKSKNDEATPAQAGAQLIEEVAKRRSCLVWVPAFAGMTLKKPTAEGRIPRRSGAYITW